MSTHIIGFYRERPNIIFKYTPDLLVWVLAFVSFPCFRKRHLSSHGVTVVTICLYRGLGAAERAKKLAI